MVCKRSPGARECCWLPHNPRRDRFYLGWRWGEDFGMCHWLCLILGWATDTESSQQSSRRWGTLASQATPEGLGYFILSGGMVKAFRTCNSQRDIYNQTCQKSGCFRALRLHVAVCDFITALGLNSTHAFLAACTLYQMLLAMPWLTFQAPVCYEL